jgi:CRP-like cAMP-binding protein
LTFWPVGADTLKYPQYDEGMQPLVANLMRYPLPALLGSAFCSEWLSAGTPVETKPGQILFHTGSPGTDAYLLTEGRIRVLKVSSTGVETSVGLFQPGQMFGEYALLAPHKNTATCRAAEASRLMQLPLAFLKERLVPVLRGTPLKNWLRLHAVAGFLRSEAFLGFLSAASVTPMLERGIDIRVAPGNTIQADGLLDNRWGVIRNGEAKLETDDANQSVTLRAGACFGEGCLLGNAPSGQVVAVSAVTCWTLQRERFLPSVRGGSQVSLLQSKQDTVALLHRPCEWLPQRSGNDCGVAALTMALRHLGRSVTQDQVAALLPLDERGSNVRAVGEAARKLGLHASAVRISPAQLHDVRLPAVAHLADGHFVTLFSWKEGRLYVGDPADGIKAIEVAAFAARWSRNLVLLT